MNINISLVFFSEPYGIF